MGQTLSHVLVIGALAILFSSCSSTSEEDDEVVTRAHPYSFLADGFMQDHIPPYHERNETNSMPFYFKQCAPTGEHSYFSKSSYFCGGME